MLPQLSASHIFQHKYYETHTPTLARRHELSETGPSIHFSLLLLGIPNGCLPLAQDVRHLHRNDTGGAEETNCADEA